VCVYLYIYIDAAIVDQWLRNTTAGIKTGEQRLRTIVFADEQAIFSDSEDL
jgi:hypothetical protein